MAWTVYALVLLVHGLLFEGGLRCWRIWLPGKLIALFLWGLFLWLYRIKGKGRIEDTTEEDEGQKGYDAGEDAKNDGENGAKGQS